MEKIIESKRVSNDLNGHFFFVWLPAIYQTYYNDVLKKRHVVNANDNNRHHHYHKESCHYQLLKTSLIFFISVVLKLEKNVVSF